MNESNRRHVPLHGALNFRDLGGYETSSGQRVRHGLVYRSADLAELTDEDIATIGRLGIRVVYDLRGDVERAARPNRMLPDVVMLARERPSSGSAAPTLEEQIVSGTLPEPDDNMVSAMYVRQLDETMVEAFRSVIELCAYARQHPLVFHCAAGKDRTGLAAAVLLGLLGADDQTLVADYALTSRYWMQPRFASVMPLVEAHGASAKQVRQLLDARVGSFRHALAHVHHRWGGFEGYAIDVLGLDGTFIDTLRTVLLE